MNLVNINNVSVLMVFVEGLISFFSPCVVPLLPLYIGYLSGNATSVNEAGETIYERKKVLFQTICFVLGISCSFIILGLAFTSFGKLLAGYQSAFQIVAGILIIVLGLFQLGIFKIGFMNQEYRLPFKINANKMNPLVAFVLGFLFSFTWTPCVGPALSSILLLVSSSQTGILFVLVYALGFVIPFLLLGLFTTQVLNFLKKNKNLIPTIVKIGAVILICIGVYSTYQGIVSSNAQSNTTDGTIVMPNVMLKDVDGNLYQMEDYKGKPLIVSFMTTWCQYCKQEMAVFEEINQSRDDVQIITILVVRDETKEEVQQFIDNYGGTFPILIDVNGEVAVEFGVSSYPKSFVVSKDFEVLGYIPGYLPIEEFEKIIIDITS